MYDPLIDTSPGQNVPYPDSYWANGVKPTSYPQAEGEINTDVAIIGGGYTGLSCAYHLARQGVQVTLLEANQVGWGCSGRNGGFVLNGTGRLSFPQMQQKWGEQTARLIYAEYRCAIDKVAELVELGNIKCDQQSGGYLKVAHRPKLVSGLEQQAELMRNSFDDPVQFIDRQQLQQHYMKNEQAYGGLLFPYCFGVHPLKMAQGYAALAHNTGAQLHQGSPVINWQKQQDKQILHTPSAHVRANKVVIASNGYTLNKFHPEIDNRHFPVLSSIIVTEPLTAQQLTDCGLKPGLMVMDTRSLKYYYRLLPDNRILFGGRGAIYGKQANHPVYKKRLLTALKHSFPQLDSLKAEYFWSGWVSVSLDDYPRIAQAESDSKVFYAMGYCGSGVSFASQAGYRLAQRVMGENNLPGLPFFSTPLKKFPFSPFRRLGLAAFYHWGRFKDEWL